jgi:hypothetical protein
MDGLEIAPCSIVSDKFRSSNKGRGPAGALLRGPLSGKTSATVDRAARRRASRSGAAGYVAGQRHGMQRQRRGPGEQGQLLLGEKCYCCLTVQHI